MKILLLSLCLVLSTFADLYELRTYTAHEGKLAALEERFRDHTLKIFESHGMKNVGYWRTEKKEGEQPKLVYLLAHKDGDAARVSWDAFRKDPAWKEAFKASRVNGKLVKKIESQFLTPTDYSKLK
ncbi:MAG: NIPSNAP family protein [Akkermansiaceae bacterium]